MGNAYEGLTKVGGVWKQHHSTPIQQSKYFSKEEKYSQSKLMLKGSSLISSCKDPTPLLYSGLNQKCGVFSKGMDPLGLLRSHSTLLCKLSLFPAGFCCAFRRPLLGNGAFQLSPPELISLQSDQSRQHAAFLSTQCLKFQGLPFLSHFYTHTLKCLCLLTHPRRHQTWKEQKLNAFLQAFGRKSTRRPSLLSGPS